MRTNHEDIQVVLTNTGKYSLYEYKDEKELDDMIAEHSSEIFGNDSQYFNIKRKIRSKAGLGTIPDGYVIDFRKRKLYVIEVELIRHDLCRHILPQIATFTMALENENSIEMLVEMFVKELHENKKLKRNDLELIVKNWDIVIIIDDIGDPNKQTNQLMEVIDYLSKQAELKTIPFQTYTKGICLSDDHIHSFRSFTKDELEKESKKWTFKWTTVPLEELLRDSEEDLKYLFAELSRNICCIAPNVKEVHRKKWTTYQTSPLKNFCTVKIMNDTLEVNMKIDKSTFKDEKGIAKDIKRTPAWTFDKVFTIKSSQDIDYAISLIEQAYQSICKA